MWQVLAAAAAAAGSAILAKKLNHGKPFSGLTPSDQEHAQEVPSQSQKPIFRSSDELEETISGNEGEIFRFSSLEKGSEEFENSSEEIVLKGPNISKKGKKKGKVKKVVDRRACASGNTGKRAVCVCLKKRRTSKDNAFNWGVGIGIMYMLSAGKTVQELKSDEMGCKKINDSQGFGDIEERNESKSLEQPLIQENGDPQQQLPDVLEMDQLQAELEFELQKLPWIATEESSGSEGRNDHLHGCSEKSYHPMNGVSPFELNQKLSTLLLERQENQIVELESELQAANRLLREKEAELRALRDCVQSLTQLSVSGDEETEDERKKSSKESTVGMKRSLDSESYSCFTV